jgi:hypothetical protein
VNLLQRNDNESYIQFMKRVIASVKNGVIEYSEMGDSLLGSKNVYSSDNLRKAFYILDKICDIMDEPTDSSDDILKELEQRRFEIQKERKKLQVINSVYQENARLEGRYELYLEQILDAIKNLKPIVVPELVKNENNGAGIGCLFISDAHYGRTTEIFDLEKNIINKYSPEEFESRMWRLLDQLEEDKKFSMYSSLRILDCGDSVEGILRSGSSLLNLKYGSIDSGIKYANFISTWICACSARLGVSVDYSLVGGNHDLIRILDSKPQFEEENIAKFIVRFIEEKVKCERLQHKLDGKKFEVTVRPYSAVCYEDFYGTKVMSYHGESKSIKNDITFFENMYNVSIDILFGGHLHHGYEEDVGIGSSGNKEVIRLPSICGIDDFAVKIRNISRAGAKFVNFTSRGKDFEKTYWLS